MKLYSISFPEQSVNFVLKFWKSIDFIGGSFYNWVIHEHKTAAGIPGLHQQDQDEKEA